MIWRLVVVAFACSACSSAAGPPRGPDYTPEGTPETESVCPAEWKEAKAAREALLGNDSAAARQKTAETVLVQAECERAILSEGSFRAGVHADILKQVEALRTNQRDTQNLYSEVANYGIPLLRVAAITGRGHLSGDFARRLKAVPMPTDITAIGEQSAFRSEVAALVNHFEAEAERELRDAVGLADTVAGSDAHRQRACQQISLLERQLPDGCSGR